MLSYTHFTYCPQCGKTQITDHTQNSMCCADCGYTYFHNTAAAVAGIIECNSAIVLTRRNHDPKKGYLDLPGGFVDYNETAEAALAREITEELQCCLAKCTYFCSFPNKYRYKGVDYFSCDIIFICRFKHGAVMLPNDEIMDIVLTKPRDIDLETIAFPSIRAALEQYALLHQ